MDSDEDVDTPAPTECPLCKAKPPRHRFNCPTRYEKVKLKVNHKKGGAIAYKPGRAPAALGDENNSSDVSPTSSCVTIEYTKSTFATVTCTMFIEKLRTELGCFNEVTVVVDGGAGWKTLHPDSSPLADFMSDKSNIHANILPMQFLLHFNPNEIVFDTSGKGPGQKLRSPVNLVFESGSEYVSLTIAGLREKIQQVLRSKSIVTRIEVRTKSKEGTVSSFLLQGKGLEDRLLHDVGVCKSGIELYLRFQDKKIEVSIPRAPVGLGGEESPKLLPVVAPPRSKNRKSSKKLPPLKSQQVQKWLANAFLFKSKDMAKKACRAGEVLFGYRAGATRTRPGKRKKGKRRGSRSSAPSTPPLRAENSESAPDNSKVRYAKCKPTKEIQVGDKLKIIRIWNRKGTGADSGKGKKYRKEIQITVTALLRTRCRADARLAFECSDKKKRSTDAIMTMFHDVAKHGRTAHVNSRDRTKNATPNRSSSRRTGVAKGRAVPPLALEQLEDVESSPFSPGGGPRRQSHDVNDVLQNVDFGNDAESIALVKSFFDGMVKAPHFQVDIAGGDTSHNYAIGDVFVKQLDETQLTVMLDPEQSGFLTGEGPYREEAAYAIDHWYDSFSAVPVTKTVMVRKGGNTPLVTGDGTTTPQQVGKAKPVILQRFLQGLSNCEDRNLNVLLRALPPFEVHKVAVFDLRFFNTDRHGGNLMVTASDVAKVDEQTKLIPIDHAYCLPDFLHLGSPKYEWCECEQAGVPVSRSTAEQVQKFDAARDAKVLRSLGIREACIVTLVLATRLLQIGLREGRTLLDIAHIQQRKQVRNEVRSAPPTASGNGSPTDTMTMGGYHDVDRSDRNRTISLSSLQSLSSMGNGPDGSSSSSEDSSSDEESDSSDSDDSTDSDDTTSADSSDSSSSSSDSEEKQAGSAVDSPGSASLSSPGGLLLVPEGDLDYILPAEALSDFERLICSSLVESLRENEEVLVHYLLCSEALRAFFASIGGIVTDTVPSKRGILQSVKKPNHVAQPRQRQGRRGRRRRGHRKPRQKHHSHSPVIKGRTGGTIDRMDLDDDNDNNNNNTSDNNNSIGNGKGNINDNGNDNDGNAKASDSGVHQDGVVGDDAGWEMEESDSGSYALQLCFLSDALLQHLIFADCIGDRQLIKQLVSQGTVSCPDYLDYIYAFDEGFSDSSSLGAAFSPKMRTCLKTSIDSGSLAPAVSQAAASMRLALPPLPEKFLDIFDRNVTEYFRVTGTLSERDLKRYYYSSSVGNSERSLHRYYKSNGSRSTSRHGTRERKEPVVEGAEIPRVVGGVFSGLAAGS